MIMELFILVAVSFIIFSVVAEILSEYNEKVRKWWRE